MKKFSKILSFVLVLIMVMTALPVSAIADGMRDFTLSGIRDWISGIGDARPGFDKPETYPEQNFAADTGDGLTVTVSAPDGALPAGSTMTAVRVGDIDAVQAVVDQSADVNGTVLTAVDITFYNKKGQEIQPRQDVTVTISSAVFNGRRDICVVHIDSDANGLRSGSNKNAELVNSSAVTGNAVTFSARSFSVYAVIGDNSGEQKFLTVEFYDRDGIGEGNLINVQRIRLDKVGEMINNGNIVVYDPGVPTLASNEAFTGWNTTVATGEYSEEISDLSVEDIIAYIEENYQAWMTETEEHVLQYIAQVYDVIFIFYCDQYGAIYNSEPHAPGDVITIASDYVPVGPSNVTVGLAGWVEYKDNTYVNAPGQKSGETTDYMMPQYNEGAAANAANYVPGSTYTLNRELVLFPYITSGHWITFDSNVPDSDPDKDTRATFTAPRFVSDDELPSAKKPADPTRLGYEFDQDWYTTANGNTKFDWNTPLTGDVTVYAHWNAQQVTYHIVVWTQKADDAFNSSTDPQATSTNPGTTSANYNDLNNEYDYKDMSGASSFVATGTAAAGSTLTVNNLPNADKSLGGTESSALGYYFLYNGPKTEQKIANTVVKGDGSTVVNVYYDRKVITYKFGSGDYEYYSVSNPDWADGKVFYTRTGTYSYTYYECMKVGSYYYTEVTGSLSTSSTYYIYYNDQIYQYKYNSSYSSFVFYADGSYKTWSGTVFNRSSYPPSGTIYTSRYVLSSVTKTIKGLYGAQLKSGDWPTASSGKVWSNFDEGVQVVYNYPLALTEYVPTWLNGVVTLELRFFSSNYSSDLNVYYKGQALNGSDYTESLASGRVAYSGKWYPNETMQGFTVYGYRFGTSGSWTRCTTDDVINIPSSGSNDLYVAFTRNTYHLTFISNGTELNDISNSAVYYQDGLSNHKPDADYIPANGAKGMYFTGWYKNPECSVAMTAEDWADTMPANDLAIYAGWAPAEYRIEFEPTDGGKIGVNTISAGGENQSFTAFYVDYGEKIDGSSLSMLGTTVPGYTFGGWFLDAAHTQRFNFNTEIGPDVPGMDNTYREANWPSTQGKLILYAQWNKTVAGAAGISIIYDAVEGQGIIRAPYPEEVVKPDPLLYTNGATAFGRYAATPIDSNGNDDPDRIFLYWEIRDEQGNVIYKVYPGQPFPVNIDWAVETASYTITWHYKNANGQDVTDTTTVAEGMRPTHATPSSYVSGSNLMEFAGWVPTEGQPAEGVVYPVEAHEDASYTATYQQGEVVTYTVTFIANGGSFGGNFTNPQTVNRGAYATAPTNINPPSGKRFVGWYMNDGTTLMTSDEVNETAINANTTFTAQYKDAGFTVTFNANGGYFIVDNNHVETIVREDVAQNYTLSLLYPADPDNDNTVTLDNEPEDLYFYGWFTAPNGGTQYTGNEQVTGNMTVYAHWCTKSWERYRSTTLTPGDMYSFDIPSGYTGYGSSLGVGTPGSYLSYSTTSSTSVPEEQRWTCVGSGSTRYLAYNSNGTYYYIAKSGSEGYTTNTQSSASAITLSVASSSNGYYYIKSGSYYLQYTSSYSYSSWFIWDSSSGTPFKIYHYQETDQNAAKKAAESGMPHKQYVPEDRDYVAPVAEPTRDGVRAASTYELATTLDVGSKYLLVVESGTTSRVMTNTVYSSNNCPMTAVVTVTSNTISGDYTNYELVVGGSASGYTFYNNNLGKYIGIETTNYNMYFGSVNNTWTYSNNNLINTTTSTSYRYVGLNTTNNYLNVQSSGNASTVRFYKLVEGGGSSGGDTYVLLTAAPDDWEGEYVITSGTTTSAYMMASTTGNYYNNTSAKTQISGSGVTLSNNTLSNVPAANVFTVAKSTVSGYTSKYSIMNNDGRYLADSGSGLTTITTNTGYGSWNMAYYNNNLFRINSAGYSTAYYIRYSNSYFDTENSTTVGVYLWKKVESTTTTYTVTATSGGNGTITSTNPVTGVAADGTATFTVQPSTGYVLSGATVTSGTAGTPTINATNNTVTVPNVQSDVAVTINFTALQQYTVTYLANGNSEGSNTVYAGNSVTLPSSVSSANTPSGYTFIGWSTGEVSDTTTRPNVLTGSYTPTGDVTLYAVFSYGVATGNVTYVYASTLEDGGKYIIVDNASISGTTGYAVGNTVVTNNHYLTPISVTISNNTCTVSTTNLPKVLWEAAAVSGGYTFYNSAVGKYLGFDSSDYLYPSATALTWSYSSNNLSQSVDTEYPYLSYDTTNGRYTTSGTAKTINFYKETPETETHYTTGETTYTVTAQVSGGHGSISSTNPVTGVSMNGTATFTAVPDAGYEVDTVAVTSGTATASHNGNTITVSGVQSNATVTVTFKQSVTTNYTVTYHINGTTDEVSVPAGSYTLRTTATAPSGYTFVGWVGSQVADTTQTQTYYAPGASVTISGNTDFYALYTYVEGGTGTVVYELVTNVLDDWSGKYVISYGETSSMYVFKGVTGSSSGASYETSSNRSAFADSGITLSDAKLYNVSNDYVFIFEAQGDYYSIKSVSTGAYVGMNSSSYLRAYSSYNSTYCRWTPAVNSSTHAAQLKNAANGSYPYLGWSTEDTYFWSASSGNANVLRLWKETTDGTTHWTTDPSTVYTIRINYELPSDYTLPEGYDWPLGFDPEHPYVELQYTATGESYSVDSPVIPGLTASQATVSGTVTGSDTITVTYTKLPTHTVTVNYYNGAIEGTPFQTTQKTVYEGLDYYIASPELPGYTPSAEAISGIMGNEDIVENVVYTAESGASDKTYTITLYAVYGPVNKTGKTHIYWYSNDDAANDFSGGDVHQDLGIDIDKPTLIPTPEDFYTVHTSNGNVVTRDGELEWEEHVFLGWARLEHDNHYPNGKIEPELNEDDLYLKYIDGKYFAEFATGWEEVTKVAADEMQPYHDMYAVWASVFYVYHSGTNEVERIVASTKAGTYDLTAHIPEGSLYGGYYKSYAGMGQGFKAKSLNWESVDLGDLVRGLCRQTEVNGSVAKDTNTGVKAYNAANYSSIIWDWDQSYNIDTVDSNNVAKAADAPGNAIKPEAGMTYYIKEVPAELYLRPYLHYTYKLNGPADGNGNATPGTITKIWLISDIDDGNYRQAGFVLTDEVNGATNVVSSLTINTTGGNSTSVRLTPESVFHVSKGYLSYKTITSPSSLNGKSIRNYWVTPDGLLVTGANYRRLSNCGTVTGIHSTYDYDFAAASTINVYAPAN